MAEREDSTSTEQTFQSYTSDQGSRYARYRAGYPKELFQRIINHHLATGGQLDTIIDAGCGPGPAIRGLAPSFKHAIGLDASEGMIQAAGAIGGVTGTSEKIQFYVSTAEDLGSQLDQTVPEGSADLIVASSAAHWFNMERFWPRAAQVLKSCGTVAVWHRITPRFNACTPNHKTIQAAYDEAVNTHLGAYYSTGNFIEKNEYKDLVLPWNLDCPVSGFDLSSFSREIWQGAKSFDQGSPARNETGTVMDLDTLEEALSTTSPVTRWRDAHPDDIGTERDVVRMIRRKTEILLHEAGVEPGEELLWYETPRVVLLMIKKM